MGRITEALDGGLWTATDPALLQPGQLSGGQNFVYAGGSPAIRRATGRSAFGTATAAAVDVVGLRDIQFDNGNHYIVAMASSNLVTAVVGDTGTFGLFTTLAATAAQLEAVHYRNRFYLFNGATADASVIGSNVVAYLTATAVSNTPSARQHGLLPVIDAPTITTAAGTATVTVTGYYEYWTTEVARLTQDGAESLLESTFSGPSPSTVFISATSVVPSIQRPGLRNPSATHWRIYRSTKKDTAVEKRFPTGFLIAEAGTGTSAQADTTSALNTGFVFASASSSGAQLYHTNVAGASGMFAEGTTEATFSPAGIYAPARAQQGLYGYGFTPFNGSIGGIEVVVRARVSSGSTPQWLSVTMGARDNVGGGFQQQFWGSPPSFHQVRAGKSVLVTSASLGDYTLGGSSDRWFFSDEPRQMVDSDFTGAGFLMLVDAAGSGYTLGVDSVKTKIYYGPSSTLTVPFPTVVYTFGDITAQVGKNGAPPSSSTGDLFEDTLVLNDVTNPALIRWSSPGEPDYFPPTYYIDFETRENDQVRLIKTVNSQLVVALDSSIWRVNYLPSERDSSFDRGKAIAPISRSYGCVNPMCACVFSMDGRPEMLAFVSNVGIHVTDGFSFDTYTDGLDWSLILPTTSTSAAIDLVNDRQKQELVFHYRNDANGNETYLALHLNYSSDHLVHGKPKVSGPVHMRNFLSTQRGDLKSAWPIDRSNGATEMFLGYGGATAAGAGQVYRETGTTIPAEDSTMRYVTRRMYQAGFAQEWNLAEMYGYAGTYTGTPTVSYSILNTKTDDTGETTLSTKTKTLGGQKLHHVQFAQMLEGARVSAIVTASAYAQESLILEGEGFGVQDSGL